MAEIGVYRGDFAAEVLRRAEGLQKYYLIDPWRHLADWNKPANESDEHFERLYHTALEQTAFAAHKRVVLRGKTTEVIEQIPDGSLDFAYIDGDHTLRGITIDLIRIYPKIREGGWMGGDDFCRSIWQHANEFEPTLVFPFAVYFAEAVAVPILALPGNQFLMQKAKGMRYELIDLAGTYGDSTLAKQLNRGGGVPTAMAQLKRLLCRA